MSKHIFFLQRVSLKGRFRGHSQRNPKAKKGSPHRKSKIGLAMGPASDLELLKLLGVGPRAAPREEGPLRPWLHLKEALKAGKLRRHAWRHAWEKRSSEQWGLWLWHGEAVLGLFVLWCLLEIWGTGSLLCSIDPRPQCQIPPGGSSPCLAALAFYRTKPCIEYKSVTPAAMMALFQAFALPGAKTRSKINKASILMSWVISFYRAAGCSLAKLHPLGSLPSIIDRWERIVSWHAYVKFLPCWNSPRNKFKKQAVHGGNHVCDAPWWRSPHKRHSNVERRAVKVNL